MSTSEKDPYASIRRGKEAFGMSDDEVEAAVERAKRLDQKIAVDGIESFPGLIDGALLAPELLEENPGVFELWIDSDSAD